MSDKRASGTFPRSRGIYSSITQDLNAFLTDEHKGEKVLTNIVCTIGPASWDYETMRDLINAGMICARMNFSHGNHEGHQKVIDTFRKVCDDTGSMCALMLDTKGPEIRTCSLKPNPDNDNKTEWLLEKGNRFTVHSDPDLLGDNTQVAVTYSNIPQVLQVGDCILIDDGLIALLVDEVKDDRLETIVQNTGWLATHKGVNLPGAVVDLPAVTDKDKLDIAFGVKNDVDFIAASFIRNAQNVRDIRALPGVKRQKIRIISKIENAEGLTNFLEILEETDGIMVARGDLAVEIPLEKVPSAQKMMIRHCNRVGKPVITATQMMESMTVNPRPTRAEVTDVANSVFDGTDCVMLSGESAKGKYPVETVKTMKRICGQAERDIDYRVLYRKTRANATPPIGVADSICSSAVKTAWDIQASLIIGLTESGATATLLSKYRAGAPILCVTPNAQVARQAQLARGVFPIQITSNKDNKKLKEAVEYAIREGFVEIGDKVVLASGVLTGLSGGTNMLKVFEVEDPSPSTIKNRKRRSSSSSPRE